MYTIFCQHCGVECGEGSCRVACPACGGPLDFRYPESTPSFDGPSNSMWKYRDVLPVREGSTIVSMREGATPLEKSRSQAGAEIFIKNETFNPTGSHKDRALSIGVTKALEFGRDTVMLYSDGSTALASAAYAARAGLRNITVVAAGAPSYRLLPLMVYNSHLLEYQGTGAEALDWTHRACQSLGIYEVSTYRRANPYDAEGPKTIGLEIFDQLGRVPDWVVVPVGGGGTLAGVWRAFVELESWGRVSKCPRLVALLPERYTMLEAALQSGVKSEEELRALAPRQAPPTVQAKIAMSYPPDGLEAIAAIRESEGMILYASDREALEAQRKLGTCEGIYAEPSAAAAWAGVEKLLSSGRVGKADTIVAVITGSGFRETGGHLDGSNVAKAAVDSRSGTAVLEKILGI